MTYGVECTFVFTCTMSIPFGGKFLGLLSIVSWVVYHIMLSFMSTFHILTTNPLSNICFSNIFSQNNFCSAGKSAFFLKRHQATYIATLPTDAKSFKNVKGTLMPENI